MRKQFIELLCKRRYSVYKLDKFMFQDRACRKQGYYADVIHFSKRKARPFLKS